MLRFFKVTGNSLMPAFQEGDFVLAFKIPFLYSNIHPGDVIAFQHAPYGTMIKQVERISDDGGEFRVRGTHAHSVDSRRFGPIQKKDILGKVIWHIKKPAKGKH